MKEVLSKVCILVLSFFSGYLLADVPESSITFINKISIIADKKNQLLGASSIRYDKAQKRFIILSDDTGAYPNVFGEEGDARYYTFPLSDVWSDEKQDLQVELPSIKPDLKVHKVLHERNVGAANKAIVETPIFEGGDSGTSSAAKTFGQTVIVRGLAGVNIKKGGVDIESITTFGDDELLIVSENGVWEWDAFPSLLKIDSQSKLTGFYRFPSRYTDNQPWYRTASHYPNQYQDVDGKGIKRNKGIKSIDRINGTNEYIAIVEAPLIQDLREWNQANGMVPTRLLHFSMDEFTGSEKETGLVSMIGEYFYPFSDLPEELTRNALGSYPKRSVSDVEVVNDRYALVLEKSYIKYNYIDNRKPKFVTELYLVRLKSSHNFVEAEQDYPESIQRKKHKTLKKTLLMRSTDMEKQLPEFTRLNIEGITLGPEFADGSRLLVLINDNDAYNAKVKSSWSEPASKFREFMFSKSGIVPAYFWVEGGLFDSPLFRDKEPTHLLLFKIPADMLGKNAFQK